MKTVTKTALANVRQNKHRNIISGIAIILTTLLIFMVLTVGYASISVRFAGVNAYYPTFHGMFRQVPEENAWKLKSHTDMKKVGLRAALGRVMDDDSTILFLWMDAQALELNKVELSAGTFPREGNEIVVSREMLLKYGITAEIGDEITLPWQLYERNGAFRICGFLKESSQGENKSYSVLVSRELLENTIPVDAREYRVMFVFDDVNANIVTTDDIEEQAKGIGKSFGIAEDNVIINTDYIMANYTDPAGVLIAICIILVVMAVGSLTTYSIYYVSMIPKVQEYGKLKAMGATQKQIGQIILREGLFVTIIALPFGLGLGSLLAKPIVSWIYRLGESSVERKAGEIEFYKVCVSILENGEVQILYGWIYFLTIITVIVTVCLAFVKPMRMAAKISPIEAMRYNEIAGGITRERNGFEEMSLTKLTIANLSRNRKRFLLTVVTLGAIGILFMVVSTILSCTNPREMAKQDFEGDYEISINSWENDKMNPDRSWASLIKDNPLDEEFIEKVCSINGVKSVKVKSYLTGTLLDLDPDREIAMASIQGLDESYREVMERGQIEGHVTYEELQDGDKILMSKDLLHWFPELQQGDSILMELETSTGSVEKIFEIAAIGDYASAISWNSFVLPTSVLEEIAGENLSKSCTITLENKLSSDRKQDVFKQLESLANENKYFVTDSYEKHLATWETATMLMMVLGYAFLFILGVVGMMNLVNTMLNSIYTRQRELGIIQAIGMSQRQLVKMLQLEGIFYTVGTLIVSLGIGSLAGYGVFLYAKAENIMNITEYHYPVIPMVILVIFVAMVQIGLTYAISRSFRRVSLIERIRYAG